MKDPVTDKGKRSKAGRLALIMQGERYKTIRLEDGQAENLLGTVFENGVLFADDKLSDIRKRAIVR